MGSTFYTAVKTAFRVPRFACIREQVLGAERTDITGPLILACSHLSHLEPAFVSSVVPRHIRWMSRIEFYRPAWAAAMLNWGGAFPVDRFGNAAPAVRTAVRLLRSGEVVGMFPEGGVALGKDSVLRGAMVREGVCTIAIAAQVPVVPVVVLGTNALNSVKPWLPTKSARVWMAFGEPIAPPARTGSRRALRKAMTPHVIDGFVGTYQRLLRESGLRDEQVP